MTNAVSCTPLDSDWTRWISSRVVCWAILIGVILFAYANSFGGDFVFDGIALVQNNAKLQSVDEFLTTRLNGRWIANLTFALNHELFGADPWSFHVVNVVIHMANGVLLYELLRALFQRAGGGADYANAVALAATLLWAVHPLQTQAVTYIYQRYESLASFFYLAMLVSLIRGGSKGKAWLLLSIFMMLLGVYTKPILITAPAIALCMDRLFLSQSWKSLLFSRWWYYGALLLIFAIRFGQIARNTPALKSAGIGIGIGITRLEYALSQPGVILHYIRLWFFPVGQNIDYQWPIANDAMDIAPALAICSVLFIASCALIAQGKAIGFAGFWFFVLLSPTSSVVPIIDLAFEHRVYLASAALAVLSTLLIHKAATLINRRRNSTITMSLVASCAIISMILTHARNKDYQSGQTMWLDVIEKAPENSRAYYALSTLALYEQDYESTYRYAENVLQIEQAKANSIDDRDHPAREKRRAQKIADAYVNMAKARPEEPETAIQLLESALEVDPQNASARNELAAYLFEARGDSKQAEKLLREALELRPGYVDALMNLGGILASQGEYKEAIGLFERAVRRSKRTDFAIAAASMLREYNSDQSLGFLRQATVWQPENTEVHSLLGELLAQRGDVRAAQQHYRLAIEHDSKNVSAYNGLAICLAQSGQLNEAERLLLAALRIAPDYVDARANLALVRQAKVKP